VSPSSGKPKGGRGSPVARPIEVNLRKAQIDGQFIAGDGNTQVQLRAEHGATVNLVEPAPAPMPVQPPIHLLPAEHGALVGRDDVLARLRRLIEEGRVEITGEDGIGKTALVSHLLHEVAQTRERLIYVDCSGHRSPDGILAELFFAHYECDYAIAPAPQATSRYLKPIAGLVALDHVELDRSQLESVINSASSCEILVVNSSRMLAGLAVWQSVDGLAPADGAALLAREVGRVVTPSQDAELQELALAWNGHPLRLHRCADLLRENTVPIRELIDAGVALHGAGWMDARQAATLEPDSHRLLVLLAAVAPYSLHETQIAALMQETDAVELLRDLRRRGLIESHSPRYSVRPNLHAALVGEHTQQEESAVALARAYARWTSSADLVELYASAGALLRLQNAAFQAEDWLTAATMTRGLDTMLALAGRWEDWRWTLVTAQAAARRADDTDAQAWSLHQLGVCAFCGGESEEAGRRFQEASALRRRRGDHSGASVSEANLRAVDQAGDLAGSKEVELRDYLTAPAQHTVPAEESALSGGVIGELNDEEEASRDDEERGQQMMEAT
jgi:hypothetical protein